MRTGPCGCVTAARPGSAVPSAHSMKNGRYGSAAACSSPAVPQRRTRPSGAAREPSRTASPSRPRRRRGRPCARPSRSGPPGGCAAASPAAEPACGRLAGVDHGDELEVGLARAARSGWPCPSPGWRPPATDAGRSRASIVAAPRRPVGDGDQYMVELQTREPTCVVSAASLLGLGQPGGMVLGRPPGVHAAGGDAAQRVAGGRVQHRHVQVPAHEHDDRDAGDVVDRRRRGSSSRRRRGAAPTSRGPTPVDAASSVAISIAFSFCPALNRPTGGGSPPPPSRLRGAQRASGGRRRRAVRSCRAGAPQRRAVADERGQEHARRRARTRCRRAPGRRAACHMFTPSAIPVAIIASTVTASAQCTASSERVNLRTSMRAAALGRAAVRAV